MLPTQNWTRLVLSVLLLLVSVIIHAEKQITDLPGYGAVRGYQETGYLPVGNTFGSELFYWYVKCDIKDAPLVLWLNGGPGCPSLIGFFTENGPYTFNSNNNTLDDNAYSWHLVANMIYIDQPLGTGFSPVNSTEEYVTSEKQGADQMYKALLHFMTIVHPEFADRALFLTGESYAGKYIPTLAARIVEAKLSPTETTLNLVGVAIGDGLIDPLLQRFVYSQQALAFGLINFHQKQQIDAASAKCKQLLLTGQFVEATQPCSLISRYIHTATGGINNYDLREYPSPSDDEAFIAYLNDPALREAVGASELVPIFPHDNECNGTVSTYLAPDRLASVLDVIPPLFEHMRVLLYSGNFDLQDGPLGIEEVVNEMQWSGAEKFATSQRDLWVLGDTIHGFYRSHENLALMVIVGAGHFVPKDQPQAALELLRMFMADLPFTNETASEKMSSSICDILSSCNGNGVCASAACECNEGFSGPACEFRVSSIGDSDSETIDVAGWVYQSKKVCSADPCVVDVVVSSETQGSKLQLYANSGSMPTPSSFLSSDRSAGTEQRTRLSLPANGEITVGVYNGGTAPATFKLKLEVDPQSAPVVLYVLVGLFALFWVLTLMYIWHLKKRLRLVDTYGKV